MSTWAPSLTPVAVKSVTFTGGAGLGAIGTVNLFIVTGVVKATVFAYCGTTLVGASATISVGVTSSTAGLTAVTTATSIATSVIWRDATPTNLEGIASPAMISNNIIATIATANVTAGQLDFYCEYVPYSAGAGVVAA